MDTATRVAVSLTTSGVACMAAGTWLDVVTGPPHAQGWFDVGWNWAAVAMVSVLGVRIVQRYSHHVIGWIMVAMSVVGGVTFLLELWAYAGLVWRPGRFPGAAAADVLSFASWLSAFASLAYLALYFPDGRLPSRRWRFFPYLMGVAFTGAWVGATVQPGPQGDPLGHVTNPAGITWFGGPGEWIVGTFMAGTLACIVASAVSVVLRFRRSSGLERAQLAWLAHAALLVPVALLGCFIGLAITGTDVVGEVLLPVALVLGPTGIGLAVLRYRLYDIEYLINRTLVYALLTALLFGAFVATSATVGVAVGRRSSWAIAVATLVTALAFRPARDVLQRWVDRRFDRTVTTSVGVIDGFLAELRDERADPAGIEDALAAALDDSELRVWLWLRKQDSFVGVSGDLRPEPVTNQNGGTNGRATTNVMMHDALLAEVDHRADLLVNARLLRTVLHRARLCLELARLAAESRSHAAEVDASRARIVEASYEERRRLERDLHDGAQQRLVALGVRIRRMQRSMPPAARILEPALDQTVDEISEAIADLRRLAAGLRPARLDDGLGPALEDLARSTPIAVDLSVSAIRAPATVETSAYFVACEGVTNAVKHSSATRIVVEAEHRDGWLHIRVSDDGVGGALARRGSGLAGLTDRVAAHGGQLTVSSPPGSGTVLMAELPCE